MQETWAQSLAIGIEYVNTCSCTQTQTHKYTERENSANLHPQVGMCFLSFLLIIYLFPYLFFCVLCFRCCVGFLQLWLRFHMPCDEVREKKVSMAYLNNPQFISCIYERCPLLWTLPCGSYAMLSHFSHVPLFAILWTVAHQAPMSTGFSRQEYWSGLPFPPPGDLFNSGIEPRSPAL